MSDHDETDADIHLEQTGGEPAAALADAGGPVVFILETALAAVNQHAAEEPEHEIGGILVGTVTEGERPVVFVEAAIRGQGMTHTRGSVTFTHETWNETNLIKDSQFPDLKIVGWYHSHPGFGLFLSGHDLFIHRNFFAAPWQVAVVADPLAKSWGCFTWHGTDLAQDQSVHTVAIQWSQGGAAAPAVPASDPVAAAPASPAPIIISSPTPPARDRGVTWALGVLGLLLAILVGLTYSTYGELRSLKSQVATLNQQMNAMSHELTVVRDGMPDLPTPAPAPSQSSTEAPAPPAATDSGVTAPPATEAPPPTGGPAP